MTTGTSIYATSAREAALVMVLRHNASSLVSRLEREGLATASLGQLAWDRAGAAIDDMHREYFTPR
jgi:hypothetical protein